MTGAPSYAVGWQTPVYVPNPPNGQGWSYKVDGSYHERMAAVTFAFNASAVVANRLTVLQLLDTNDNVVVEAKCGGLVAAGSFLTVNLTSDGPGFAADQAGHTFGYVPGFLVPPGWSWATFTTGMDVGDNFTGIVLLVQRFPSDIVAVTAGQ